MVHEEMVSSFIQQQQRALEQFEKDKNQTIENTYLKNLENFCTTLSSHIGVSLNPEFIATLYNCALASQREGGLLLWSENEKQGAPEQIGFLLDVMKEAKATRVLETGTNMANFSYIVKSVLPDVKIDTFGVANHSEQCVAKVNDHFNNKDVTYHHGDSRVTFPKFIEDDPEADIQFAWVDGGHSYSVCKQDLTNCGKLNIPHICVDDFAGRGTIGDATSKAVSEFLDENPQYHLAKTTDNSIDQRQIAHLTNVK